MDNTQAIYDEIKALQNKLIRKYEGRPIRDLSYEDMGKSDAYNEVLQIVEKYMGKVE